MKGLFSSHIQLVGKVMDMQLQRQNVVMSNLANISTPNYKALNLEWEQELQAALGLDARGKMTQTNQQHLPSVFKADTFGPEFEKAFRPHIVKGDDSVDLDKEMAKLSKNTLMYNAMSTIIKRNFEGLSKIIADGGK